MAKKWRWLVRGGLLCGMLLFPQILLAEPLIRLMSCPSQERLSDRELQQFRGQGSDLPYVQPGQPIGAIKLWDEWARPRQSESPATTGQNQVIVFGPRR